MQLSHLNIRDRSLFLFYAIILLVFSASIFFYMQTRSNIVAETLNRKKGLTTVFILHENNQPLLTVVYLYNHQTHQGAIFDIPSNFAVVSSDRSRYVPISYYFNAKNPQEYAQKVKNILYLPDNPFYISMNLEEFGLWTDLIGGIEAFIAVGTKLNYQGELIMLTSGASVLDGAKSREYLIATELTESQARKEELRKRFAGSMIQQMSRKSYLLANPLVIESLQNNSTSNMDNSAMREFWETIQLLNQENLIIQKVTGTIRTIDNQKFLFPHYEGRLIREMVTQTLNALSDPQESIINAWPRRIEIQNGTAINGLAQRTARIYEGLGYNVVRTSNADSQNVDYTTVIDFSGNLEAAQRVGEVIRTNRIYSFGMHLGLNDLDLVENIDIRIVLGRDFDGRYTQEIVN
ncbi:LCP family protein [Entomospira nematocerorum]|uniref:LCP family protein n=1 Tax=Entomospira nematocerorum TaxID=2719987 RepID=A0A968KYA8_9SPIO|nr:LCP family protein [Entomospira nematocera]NIZ47387.1 LCP family protein [Entomospira nematocera]WDI34073.1 LCP family protein [Entomospira nematocera]